MALPQENIFFTVEQYLALERAGEDRHEYIDGHLYKMAGESLEHSRINVNLLTLLNTQLRGKKCEALSPNMKVRSGPYIREQKSRKGMFSYPDVTIVCGEPRFHDEHRDVLVNPTVIIEILSESTEVFDRDEKFRRYQTNIDTLQEYGLVSQALPLIQVFSRHPEGWLYRQAIGLAATIRLPSIECRLPLVEVYDRIAFPPEEEAGE
ncbi:MAG: Uma2 family endonuclease [Blastocatellia bacterium]